MDSLHGQSWKVATIVVGGANYVINLFCHILVLWIVSKEQYRINTVQPCTLSTRLIGVVNIFCRSSHCTALLHGAC